MSETQNIITAIVLGFAAAISPGPILALMVSETIKYSKKEGLAVAVSPLFTDFPIFLASYFLLYKQASTVSEVSGILYVFGGVMLVYLGYKNLSYHFDHLEKTGTGKGIPSAFLKGVAVNLLNPYTYAFWFGIAINFFSESFVKTSVFFVSFFISFITTKFTIVLIVNKTKEFIKGSTYSLIIKIVGAVLIVLGLQLLFLAVERIF